MKSQRYEGNIACPVVATLDVIGGKWKSAILYHLLQGVMRFGELRKVFPEITQRMLTLQLRELEEDGIIIRKVYPQVPPKVEYSLSPLGKSLAPVIEQMAQWGEAFLKKRKPKKATKKR